MTWIAVCLVAAVFGGVFFLALRCVQVGREADEWADERQRVRAILDREERMNQKDVA